MNELASQAAPVAPEPHAVPIAEVGPPTLPASSDWVYELRRPMLDDVEDLVELCRADEFAAVGDKTASEADVREAFTHDLSPVDRTGWVVEATPVAGGDAHIAAWASFLDEGMAEILLIDIYLHPAHPEDLRYALAQAYLQPVAELVRNRRIHSIQLGAYSYLNDVAYSSTLAGLGMKPVRVYSRMKLALEGAETTPPPPPVGVLIRPFVVEDEGDWRAAHRVREEAFEQHFDYEPMTFDEWRQRVRSSPAPDLERWLLAEVDGEVVASAESNGRQLDEKGGWVGSLGVLPHARGRGIATSLLQHEFARYAADGLDWAGLDVDTDNVTRALGVYERAGMHAYSQIQAWRMTVTAAGA